MMSRRDDGKIAQDKRSAVLGNRHTMNHSLISKSGFPRRGRGNPDFEMREAGCGVALTQGSAAAYASLRRVSPWAIFWPPLPGLRRRQTFRPGVDNFSPEANQMLEPPAASPPACGGAGRCAAPLRYRGSVSGACGSAPRYASVLMNLRINLGFAAIALSAVLLCAGCGQSESAKQSKTRWVDPNTLKPGPIQHASLTEEQMSRVKRLQGTFSDADPSPLEKWVEDFRRDANPENELKIWEAMARAYEGFTTNRNLTLDAKKEAFQVVLLRSAAPEEDVLQHLKLKVLTEKDAREIMALFVERPKPIEIIKQ
jgi:hypothetical protein